MAKDFFYNLNQSKIKNLFRNLEEILLIKKSKDITVDDIISSVGISRATFYNYFNDTNELYNDLIEYLFRQYLEDALSLLGQHKNSIFATLKIVYDTTMKYLNDDKIIIMAQNFLDGYDKVIRTEFSSNMEQFLFDKLDFLKEHSVEGKTLNDTSLIYSLLSSLISSMIMSYKSYVISKSNCNSMTICLDNFNFKFKLLKNGYEQIYKNAASSEKSAKK